jgi:DNA repair protein RadD
MQLRPYQVEAIQAPFDYYRAGNKGHPTICLPTGTGKSIVLGGIVHRYMDMFPNSHIFCATHSETLVQQNSNKLLSIWPQAPLGIYHAGLNRREVDAPILWAGIDSVAKKPHLFGKRSIMLIDEAHMVDWKAKTRYRRCIEGLWKANPKMKVIGLTATPWRQGLGNIDDGDALFTHRCYSKIGIEDFHEFIANDWLATLRPLRTNLQIDTSDVATTAGDFQLDELEKVTNREEITRAAIEESLDAAADRNHWLVFCTGVKHVEDVTQWLNSYGVPAVCVHSKKPAGDPDSMDPATNNGAKNLFESGQARALCNMGVLTTGYDVPSVDYIMMLRATKSAVLWVQMLGRGTRPKPADVLHRDCLVGDFAGNTKRLGCINDPVIPRKKGQKGGGEAPVRECATWLEDPQTGAAVAVWMPGVIEHTGCRTMYHASLRVCPHCQCPAPPIKEKITKRASSDALIKESEDGTPQVEIFRVDYTSYQLHQKAGKPDMVHVSYTCGIRVFHEYLCFEHDGYAKFKAHKWFRKRFPTGSIPATSEQVIEESDFFPTTTHIRVWVNKKYPDILDWCMDGTAFGTEEAQVYQNPEIALSFQEEDIPF